MDLDLTIRIEDNYKKSELHISLAEERLIKRMEEKQKKDDKEMADNYTDVE